MTEEKIRAMLSEIVCEVDYDIWKEMYKEETAEDPDDVEKNYQKLMRIVAKYLSKG